MSAVAILIAVAIILWACSPALAVLVGRSIARRDRQSPLSLAGAGVAGKATRRRAATHLRLVR